MTERMSCYLHGDFEGRLCPACSTDASPSALEAEVARLRVFRDLWRRWVSAQETIHRAGFCDNYTDAARARDEQSKIIVRAREALERESGRDG